MLLTPEISPIPEAAKHNICHSSNVTSVAGDKEGSSGNAELASQVSYDSKTVLFYVFRVYAYYKKLFRTFYHLLVVVSNYSLKQLLVLKILLGSSRMNCIHMTKNSESLHVSLRMYNVQYTSGGSCL